MSWRLFLLLVLCCTAVVSCSEENEVEESDVSGEQREHQQVHLSLGNDATEMVVTWQTMHKSEHHGVVEYGRDKHNLSHQVSAERTKFVQHHTKFYTYRALMRHLKTDSSYYYRVGCKGSWSHTFHFRTLHLGHKWHPRLAVYGDMGIKNDRSLPSILKEVEAHKFDAILHFGDFAYDLHTHNGKLGHDFMRALEPIASRVPYMTCTGNHEKHDNFSHYDARFSMLRRPQGKHDHHKPLSERLNNHYYSLNLGPAHIIMFSTEFYYYFTQEYGYEQIRYQYEWLKADLKEANRRENRAKRPFIIVLGHRPFYCLKLQDCKLPKLERGSLRKGLKDWPPKKHHHHHHHHSGELSPDYDEHDHHHHHTNVKRDARPDNSPPGKKTFAEASDHHHRYYGLEKLFHDAGVDLYISGHEHYYFRTVPMYDFKWSSHDKKNDYTDPRYPIHIVSGSAGCFENHSHFNSKPEWLASHSLEYGYMKMKFLSSHKLQLKQVAVDKGDKTIDHVTIHKTHDYPAWMKQQNSGGEEKVDDDDGDDDNSANVTDTFATTSSSSSFDEPAFSSTEAIEQTETPTKEALPDSKDEVSESTTKLNQEDVVDEKDAEKEKDV